MVGPCYWCRPDTPSVLCPPCDYQLPPPHADVVKLRREWRIVGSLIGQDALRSPAGGLPLVLNQYEASLLVKEGTAIRATSLGLFCTIKTFPILALCVPRTHEGTLVRDL